MALGDAYNKIHRRERQVAQGSETPILWPALLQLRDSMNLIADTRRWLAAYDALEAHGPIRHYTERQYLWDHDLAYLTGVVTFPAKVRNIFVEGQGWWSMRAARVVAYRDGDQVDAVTLAGEPSEAQVAEAQAQMEVALLMALAETSGVPA